MSEYQFIRFSLLLLCLTMAAVPGFAEPPVLRVLNWSDYIEPTVIAEFEKKYNARIEYTEYSSVDEFGNYLFVDNSHYDVVFTASRIVKNMVDRNLIQNLDTRELPDYAGLHVDILKEFASQDVNGVHGIPYLWGTSGFGINQPELERLGVGLYARSWALLFDEKIRKKAASCGIVLLNERDELFAGALIYLGFSINTTDVNALQEAGTLIGSVLADVKYLRSEDYLHELADGTACVVLGYSGDVLSAIDGRNDLSYVIPDEGAAMWIDSMSIPANSTRQPLAMDFIRFMMQPDIAARNSSYLSYPSAMASALKLVDAEVLSNTEVYPSAAVLQKLETMRPLDKKTNNILHRLWVKALCASGKWCSVPLASFF